MAKTKKDSTAFRSNLEVVLSEAELKASGKALADALNSIERINGEMEMFKTQKKSEITALESVITRNKLLINTGKEFRMVECEWDYDWKAGKKTGRRLDTGDVVLRDDISEEEKQLDFAPKEKTVEP